MSLRIVNLYFMEKAKLVRSLKYLIIDTQVKSVVFLIRSWFVLQPSWRVLHFTCFVARLAAVGGLHVLEETVSRWKARAANLAGGNRFWQACFFSSKAKMIVYKKLYVGQCMFLIIKTLWTFLAYFTLWQLRLYFKCS